ncbi:M50 family metallopeptidase [Frankia sp. CNm7]|uniref:M50 family metallopeptidase n=1 Tax=Frankia nepalensis TaxID=1836974 RepID=A0A937UQ94_9ACTN|nr:M50 family metallopeptidase [Frankia nepalensis]MBL7497794.1 M50 family metallopeptidase [Frankia nepalensis]MBL7511297.1 M50 family metallopeptidase [Frankia nepalensis]MBL7517682.1 M50 family metallopeptidase [Frankia nepalensis]MBL7629863.1 M50 family metallopeptidase [Frankia nepalensis]
MLFYLAEPAALLGMILALVIGVYAHDTAQIYAAKLVRDPTPRRSGRLSTGLIPARVGPFSAVSMLIAGNGWTEPIRMNEVWRKRRFHVSAALLAGPLAYLLLAFGAIAGVAALSDPVFLNVDGRSIELGRDGGFPAEMLLMMSFTFASLFILSLIPIPPTDGGRVLFLLGPQSPGWRNASYKLSETHLGIILLLVVLLLPVLFPSLPSIVGQLAPPLVRGLGAIVGLNL